MVKTVYWACRGLPKCEGRHLGAPDAEVRKRGERTGLDTPVVHAVNDVYQVVEVLTLSQSKQKC